MKAVLSLMTTILFAFCMLALAACSGAPGMEPAASSNSGPETGGAKNSAAISNSPSRIRATVIDVGKGDCILLQVNDISVLIDTGYESTAKDVLSCMQAQGVNHLDAIIITHYDRDHIEGIRTIGQAVGVGVVYLPSYEGSDKNYRACVSSVDALGVSTERVAKEMVLHIGGARLTVFPSGVAYKPGTGKEEGNDNDMSLVVAIANGRDSYLFAGDLEKDGIEAYLAANHGQFDVLKMPHHGQRASNTSDFLEDVNPQIAVITDSKDEPANKKTLKLLKSANIETHSTSTDGTIVVESDGDGTYSVSSL